MENDNNDTPFVRVEENNNACAVCGWVGKVWAMLWSIKTDLPEYADAIAPWKTNKDYHICYRCFFKKMGVKP
jgi:hypothetical protein